MRSVLQRLFACNEEGQSRLTPPNHDNVNHEQVVETEDFGYAPGFDNIPIFADPHEYSWETDDKADLKVCRILAFLQKVMCEKPSSAGGHSASCIGQPHPPPMRWGRGRQSQ